MTEDEAKQRWCPMARIRDDEDNGLSVNRFSEHGTPVACMCIASDCMMWRQKHGLPNPKTGISYPKDGEGYCGLAGEE